MSGNAISNAVLLRRIDALEKKVAALAPANRITATTTRAGGVPPKPTDLAVVLSPGLAHLSWTGSRSSDLLTYLVEVSVSPDFVGVAEYEEAGTRFIFSDGIEGLTYYARVFALNGSRARSDASNIVTFVLGAATGSSIAGGQANLTSFTKGSSFATLNTNNEFETYGPCTFSLQTASSQVRPFVTIDVASSTASNTDTANDSYIQFELLRRAEGAATDVVVKQLRWDIYANFWPSGDPSRRQILFTMPFETPGSGSWEYRLRVTSKMAGANTATFRAASIAIEALTIQL